jgi:hypothetical protein
MLHEKLEFSEEEHPAVRNIKFISIFLFLEVPMDSMDPILKLY